MNVGGETIPKGVDKVYRTGIKTALSIRPNTNNEIVYLESGLYPLEAEIRKRQLAFWLKTKNDTNTNMLIKKVTEKAFQHNVKYINFYKQLEAQYRTPEKCLQEIEKKFKRLLDAKITEASTDVESKLGAYIQVNPDQDTTHHSLNHDLQELDRRKHPQMSSQS